MKKELDLCSENATYHAPLLEEINLHVELGFAGSIDASGNEDMIEKDETGIWG